MKKKLTHPSVIILIHARQASKQSKLAEGRWFTQPGHNTSTDGAFVPRRPLQPGPSNTAHLVLCIIASPFCKQPSWCYFSPARRHLRTVPVTRTCTCLPVLVTRTCHQRTRLPLVRDSLAKAIRVTGLQYCYFPPAAVDSNERLNTRWRTLAGNGSFNWWRLLVFVAWD